MQLASQNAPLLLALLILLATLALYGGLFFVAQGSIPGQFEVTQIINNSMPLAVAAVAQTIIVLTGGIDLSVGGMMDLSNSLAAVNIQDNPASMVGWTIIILLVGAAGGLANGLLVVKGRLQPILVTLATSAIFQGLAIRVLPQPGGSIPRSYTSLLVNPAAPTGVLAVALLILIWMLFTRTPFGVGVYAIGNDEQAARANGVPVQLTKVGAYVMSGVMVAAAGIFLAANATAGDATSGNVFTMTSIAAAVLGGVNLAGGRGSAIGAVAGAFTLTILINVLFFAHIDPLYQSFYQGLFLILAVIISTLIGVFLRRRR
ncbi:MAG TPA: ABC transporter permease [Chloroflexota bacterium]|nr:ABC transporter permease [Chloroflexota bacterium]